MMFQSIPLAALTLNDIYVISLETSPQISKFLYVRESVNLGTVALGLC